MDDRLQAAIEGDLAAVEALYRRYSPSVFRLSASLLNDLDDADEVTQDTFVYAFRNLRRYDPAKAALQTWLFTIAISRCRNKRRRKWLDTVPLAWWLRNEPRPEGQNLRAIEEWLVARGVRRDLWQTVQMLPPNLREALVLRFVGGLTYGEIGETMGCGDKAAESRVRTAIGALRRQMASEAESAPEWLEALAEAGS